MLIFPNTVGIGTRDMELLSTAKPSKNRGFVIYTERVLIVCRCRANYFEG
jgi:hypothetical protein